MGSHQEAIWALQTGTSQATDQKKEDHLDFVQGGWSGKRRLCSPWRSALKNPFATDCFTRKGLHRNLCGSAAQKQSEKRGFCPEAPETFCGQHRKSRYIHIWCRRGRFGRSGFGGEDAGWQKDNFIFFGRRVIL